MKKLIIIYFVLFSSLSYSQPGGGGGMVIENLYLKNGRRISINDPDLKLKAYELIGESFESTNETEYKLNDANRIFLHSSTFNNNYSNSHRLYIQYKNKKMVIDFHYVIPENPAGIVERMDSLVFQKGHYRFYKNFIIDQKITVNIIGEYKIDSTVNYLEIFKRVANGFTPSTIDFFNNYLLVDDYLGDNRVLKIKKSNDYVLTLIPNRNRYAVIEKRKFIFLNRFLHF